HFQQFQGIAANEAHRAIRLQAEADASGRPPSSHHSRCHESNSNAGLPLKCRHKSWGPAGPAISHVNDANIFAPPVLATSQVPIEVPSVPVRHPSMRTSIVPPP